MAKVSKKKATPAAAAKAKAKKPVVAKPVVVKAETKKVVTKKAAPKVKKQQTVRERSLAGDRSRTRRIRSTAGKVSSPIKRARQTGKKEYHMPLPDNKVGRFLKKRVRLTPKFLREATAEIKLVTWPTFRETVRLTMAVFIFSVVFAIIVGVLDFGLDKLFREVIIK